MINVYGDISGHPHDRVMAAGCYLAKEWEAQPAAAAWQGILDDAGVTGFHATDFFSGWKAFREWDPASDRHAEFAQRFASVASDFDLVGFGFGFDSLAFGQHLAP